MLGSWDQGIVTTAYNTNAMIDWDSIVSCLTGDGDSLGYGIVASEVLALWAASG